MSGELIPLGLKDTGFYQDPDIAPKVSTSGGFWPLWNENMRTFDRELTWSLIGGGGMVSSTGDLLKWMNHLSEDNPILSKTIQQNAFKQLYIEWPDLHRGASLGSWRFVTLEGTKVMEMGGANNFGNLTSVIYVPEKEAFIIVLLNGHSNKHGLRTALFLARRIILKTMTDD